MQPGLVIAARRSVKLRKSVRNWRCAAPLSVVVTDVSSGGPTAVSLELQLVLVVPFLGGENIYYESNEEMICLTLYHNY